MSFKCCEYRFSSSGIVSSSIKASIKSIKSTKSDSGEGKKRVRSERERGETEGGWWFVFVQCERTSGWEIKQDDRSATSQSEAKMCKSGEHKGFGEKESHGHRWVLWHPRMYGGKEGGWYRYLSPMSSKKLLNAGLPNSFENISSSVVWPGAQYKTANLNFGVTLREKTD